MSWTANTREDSTPGDAMPSVSRSGTGGSRISVVIPVRRILQVSVVACCLTLALFAMGCGRTDSAVSNRLEAEPPETRQDMTSTSIGRAHDKPLPTARVDETPEETLIRLSAIWDEAFARRDENLLRQVFDPSYPGLDYEIQLLKSPDNKGTPTLVDEINSELVEEGRAILTALFHYDEAPVRQRILLVGEGPHRRIAGIQDLEE